MGESDFVPSVFSQADENFKRYYEVKRRGYSVVKIAERVAMICKIDTEDIFSKGKQKTIVRARSLFCYWPSCKLGIPLTELARHLDLSVPGVGYAMERGKLIARKNYYQLLE